MKDKIVIDIDNTLWDFAQELHRKVKEACPQFPPPSEWHRWDFWRPYIEPATLYSLIKEIHMEQERFTPYPDAWPFLDSLKREGLYIIIASHREQSTFDSTLNWLKKNDLIFDQVHLSYDKSVLFNDSWGIVDDSPVTLKKAAEFGIVRTGIRNPWNKAEDHPLFENLKEIYMYLKSCYRG